MHESITHKIVRLPRSMACVAIRAYQRTLSPDHGIVSSRYPYGFCRFAPTCSEYAHTAILRYGLVSGTVRSIWRIIRCNPFSPGGLDPVA